MKALLASAVLALAASAASADLSAAAFIEEPLLPWDGGDDSDTTVSEQCRTDMETFLGLAWNTSIVEVAGSDAIWAHKSESYITHFRKL